jgi:hypothetical protein
MQGEEKFPILRFYTSHTLKFGFYFYNILFVIPLSIIGLDQTDTRLRTNCCALSSQWIFRHAPLFPYQNAGLNNGIRAQPEELTATKGAIVGTQARVGKTNTV